MAVMASHLSNLLGAQERSYETAQPKAEQRVREQELSEDQHGALKSARGAAGRR